nr:hypothetical protein [Mycobacterium sp. E3298]
METKYNDRFGEVISSGVTIRPYSDDEWYGRPAIVRYRDGRFVVDIPEWDDGIDLDYYIRDGETCGYVFEIVHPYPNAEPYKTI